MTPARKVFDLVVVGASFAGLIAARFVPPMKELARRLYFHRRDGSADEWRLMNEELSKSAPDPHA